MAYKSDTIATTVNCLNRNYFLPAIQREFVWNTWKIIMLFDSIMRGYPIGSFLFWKLAPENRYGFRFAKDPQNKPGEFWFEVGKILKFDDEDKFYDFKESLKDTLPDDTSKGAMKLFDKNLDRLFRAIWKDEAVSFYVETDQDYDRVLDIFVRANEGGTKLSKSDLLLSMITAKWQGIDAREEIYSFVDRLNGGLEHHNNFDKDFVMKSCLVLADLPVAYRVENFNNKNLDVIRDRWSDIKSALEKCVRAVNLMGVDRETLTSANALIPVAYHLLKHADSTLQGTSSGAAQDFAGVRTWLMMVLVNNVFGGASDYALTDVRKALQDASSSVFPVDAVNTRLAALNRQTRFDGTAIENFLAITYGKATTFLALSLLYDKTRWGEETWHKDHVFPQSWFTWSSLGKRGIPEGRRESYQDAANRIANLQLLTQEENIAKSDKDFQEWIVTRDTEFRGRHLIPEDDALLRFDNFEAFVEAREALIRTRLGSLFGASDKAVL